MGETIKRIRKNLCGCLNDLNPMGVFFIKTSVKRSAIVVVVNLSKAGMPGKLISKSTGRNIYEPNMESSIAFRTG
jgi:hypothetical protein